MTAAHMGSPMIAQLGRGRRRAARAPLLPCLALLLAGLAGAAAVALPPPLALRGAVVASPAAVGEGLARGSEDFGRAEWLGRCQKVLHEAYGEGGDGEAVATRACEALLATLPPAPACSYAHEEDQGSSIGSSTDLLRPSLSSSSSSSSSWWMSWWPWQDDRHVMSDKSANEWATFDNDRDPLSLVGACCCVMCAAIAAGLTIGLMSIDPLELEIKQRVGTTEEMRQAARVLPLITRHHLLLVTLLLYNACANEALPIFLDDLVPTPYAVGISVTMVLLFGEILPSALFSGPKQLRIASRLSGFVWCLIYLLAPLAVPIAWALDKLVGDHNPRKRYTRAELSALIEIHQEVKRRNYSSNAAALAVTTGHGNLGGSSRTLSGSGHRKDTSSNGWGSKSMGGALLSTTMGPGGIYSSTAPGGGLLSSTHYDPPGSMLSQDEVEIVLGVLKISSKTVQDCMVPMEQVFCLSTDEVLDEEMLALIMASGYSRIPVYQGQDPHHIRGFLLVKRLIVLDPKARRNVGSVSLRQPIVVSPHFPLIDLLNSFQEGRSHLALVSNQPLRALECITNGQPLMNDAAPLGIITLEDVIEEILQEEILDEHDRCRQFNDEQRSRSRLTGTKQVLSASLLRKHPANTTSNGGAGPSPSTTTLDDSTMGGGALQQLAVDLAVSNLEPMLAGHGHGRPLSASSSSSAAANGVVFPSGLLSPRERLKRSANNPIVMPGNRNKASTVRPRSASPFPSILPSRSSSSPRRRTSDPASLLHASLLSRNASEPPAGSMLADDDDDDDEGGDMGRHVSADGAYSPPRLLLGQKKQAEDGLGGEGKEELEEEGGGSGTMQKPLLRSNPFF